MKYMNLLVLLFALLIKANGSDPPGRSGAPGSKGNAGTGVQGPPGEPGAPGPKGDAGIVVQGPPAEPKTPGSKEDAGIGEHVPPAEPQAPGSKEDAGIGVQGPPAEPQAPGSKGDAGIGAYGRPGESGAPGSKKYAGIGEQDPPGLVDYDRADSTINQNLQPEIRLFRCQEKSTIPYEKFCNEINDCGDKSDEKYHVMTCDPFSEWQICGNPYNQFNGSCLVQRERICKGEVICSNLSACDLKCDSHYRCQKTTECVPRSTVCNGIPCDGCEEDHGWKNGIGFKCFREGRECVLPQQLLHDNISDCDGGIDLCFGLHFPLKATSRNEHHTSDNLFRDKCFLCLNDVMLIPTSRVCDGVIDCDDLSDECLCDDHIKPEICNKVIPFGKKVNDSEDDGAEENSAEIEIVRFLPTKPTECNVGAVQCENGTCISRSSICDGVRDCGDDERYQYCRGTVNCKDSIGREEVCRCDIYSWNCKTNYGKACDGKADCPLGFSKEAPKAFGENTWPEDECVAFCLKESTNFTCVERVETGYGQGPGGIRPCNPVPESSSINRTDDNNFLEAVPDERRCDGIQDCELGDDEYAADCPDRFRCDAKTLGYISITMDQICDGMEDCKNGSDETEELCGKRRFRCPSLGGQRVNIKKELVCDFMITCDDESDEKDCNDGRFYCEKGEPLFVRERQKFDGRGDCSDWSDECPTLNQTESTNAFSSRYQLIANPVLRALVWIMGLLSICGNATVLYIETKKLKNFRNLPAIAVTNRLLVINLAASDIIMGIYLVFLGIAGILMQGKYCSQDLPWRSSTSCIALGVLSVLSSETSVITMVFLTSCRLYAILRPFKSASRPRKRVVGLMMLSAWAVSLAIAFVPLVPQLSEIFVTHVQFEFTPFSRNAQMSLDGARELFSTLMTYDLKPNVTVPVGFSVDQLSWKELEAMAKKIFAHEHFKIERSFGYYSIDSVCIPKFFNSRSDRGWGFSFFVNLFNFCAFTFVASSYLAIYLKSSKRAALRSSAHQAEDKGVTSLQKKILRLIITDCCCWIPICIMAFAKLGGAYVSNTAYVVAAIVLLPINSALNPLLYSNLPDLLYKLVAGKLRAKQPQASSINTTRTALSRSENAKDKEAMDLVSARHAENDSGDGNKKVVTSSENKEHDDTRV